MAGRGSTESDPRSGRPSTSRIPENIICVWAAIYKNQQVILREVDDLGIPRTIVSDILTEDLGMKFLVAKFIQQFQSQEQKDFCAEVP